jgi:hypothetical protein
MCSSLCVLGRIVVVGRIEKRLLRPLLARKLPSQLGPAALLGPLQLAQIGHHSLPRSAAGAVRLDQRPVGVCLPVLPSNASPQEHARSLVPSALQDLMPSRKYKQEGLHCIAFRRSKRHRHWTYGDEKAKIVELFRPTA